MAKARTHAHSDTATDVVENQEHSAGKPAKRAKRTAAGVKKGVKAGQAHDADQSPSQSEAKRKSQDESKGQAKSTSQTKNKTEPKSKNQVKSASQQTKSKSQAKSAGEAIIHAHSGEHDHDHEHDHAHSHPAPGGIYLFSPSGAVTDAAALEKARTRLSSLGFRTAVDRTALAVHERFAGTDKQRLAAITRSLKQKHPVVMATRGGYGLSRLLPFIDWQAVADSGKTFIGQSDFTAFNLALLAKTGACSYAGPTAIYDFGAPRMDDLTAALFVEAMHGELEVLGFETEDADPVDARGVLWGGNLAMVASLVGTPYMPKIRGGILFLEDISEHPFRVERMLTQLWHAGILGQQKAILLGRFTEYRLGAIDNGYDLPAVVAWLREHVKVPVITGLPYGHTKVKATLPIGRKVGIATEPGLAHLVLEERH